MTEEAIVVEPPGTHRSTVIWMHGLGADGRDFASLPEALRLPPGQGIRFIFPHAPVRSVTINGNARMRAWFDIAAADDFTLQANEEHLREATARVDKFIASEKGRPVVLAGFSQGGALALYAGLHGSESPSGLLSLAGWLPVPEQLPAARPAATRPPILLLHGSADDVVPLPSALQSYAGLQADFPPPVLKTYDAGHTLPVEALADIRDWIVPLVPAPG